MRNLFKLFFGIVLITTCLFFVSCDDTNPKKDDGPSAACINAVEIMVPYDCEFCDETELIDFKNENINECAYGGYGAPWDQTLFDCLTNSSDKLTYDACWI